MRTFHIFKIKKDYTYLYENNSKILFDTLKYLYNIDKKEIKYGYNMFTQLTEKIDKNELNKSIYIKYHNKMIYSKNGNEHIINNLYKDEISILTIKSTYLLINVNHNYSSFFNILNNYGSNFFICDFNQNDYFWINDIKTLV